MHIERLPPRELSTINKRSYPVTVPRDPCLPFFGQKERSPKYRGVSLKAWVVGLIDWAKEAISSPGQPALSNHMQLGQGIDTLPTEEVREQAWQTLLPMVQQVEARGILPSNQVKRFRQIIQGYLLFNETRPIEKKLKKLQRARKIDMPDLEKTFLKDFFKANGIQPQQIAGNQIGAWNFKYLPELHAELNALTEYRNDLATLCQAALEGRYPAYLHDTQSAVGLNNLRTRAAFQANGLHYENWLNYKGSVTFQKPGLAQVQKRLERILTAIQTHYPQEMAHLAVTMRASGFEFSEGKLRSTSTESLVVRLAHLVQALPAFDNDLFGFGAFSGTGGLQLAQGKDDETPPELSYMLEAKQRLMATLAHLNRNPNPETIEIRNWSREPGKDLFQANDTGSCIALGFGRGKGSVDVMQNTFVQLAEFYNKNKQQVTGKALFFWCRDLKQNGEPVLVINTFEGRNDCCEEDPSAREALLKYANGFAKSVTGRNNVRIYTAHHRWNPLYRGEATEKVMDLHPIGNSVTGKYYFDTFASTWVKVNQAHRNVKILELKGR